MFTKAPSLLFLFPLFLLPSLSVQAQGPTTGRIDGTVKDQNGAVIAGAEVTVVSKATGEDRAMDSSVIQSTAISVFLRNSFFPFRFSPYLFSLTSKA